jgi:metal-responsive CopG/Arc/MetJ family transcriptional regulator
MPEQAAKSAREYRSNVTITLPVRLLERLDPFADRRARSAFIEQAIETALDRAEQDQDRDRAAV